MWKRWRAPHPRDCQSAWRHFFTAWAAQARPRPSPPCGCRERLGTRYKYWSGPFLASARGVSCSRNPRWRFAAGSPRWNPKRAEGLLGLAAAELTALSSGRRLAAAAQLKRLGAAVSEVLAGEPPLSIRELALDGSAVAEALGKGPGPHIGEALRYLLDRVLEHPEENTPERLRAALLDWSASGGRRI